MGDLLKKIGSPAPGAAGDPRAVRAIEYIHPEVPAHRVGSNLRHALLWSALLLSSCGNKVESTASSAASESSAASTSASASTVASSDAPPADGSGKGTGKGEKRKRFGEAAVYVDGEAKAVMRIFELPPDLEQRPKKLEDGRTVPRWRVVEYLEKLGVNIAKVREIHFLGGRGRAAILPGDELRKHRDGLLFSFTMGPSGGKARLHFPDAEVKINTTIDTIVAMTVYVDKPPPSFERKGRIFRYADGTKVDGIPYAKPEEAIRGTRIYLDGKLMGGVKRKRLPNTVLASDYDPKDPRFSFEAFLKYVDVDASKPMTAVFLRGDTALLRWEPDAYKKHVGHTTFAIAPGGEGHASMFVEGEEAQGWQPSAVLLFSKKRPPAYTITGIPTGSKSDQGSSEPLDP